MAQRKLGRTADQRKALIRNQVTNLIWYGRIETTEARAKEVRRAAERLITLAVKECDNTIEAQKQSHNAQGTDCHPRRCQRYAFQQARRPPQDACIPVSRARKFVARTRTRTTSKSVPQGVKFPVVEKLFREYGPKFKKRNEEKKCRWRLYSHLQAGTPQGRCS